MHRAEFGSAVSPIMTMPYFALILEITPLNFYCEKESYLKLIQDAENICKAKLFIGKHHEIKNLNIWMWCHRFRGYSISPSVCNLALFNLFISSVFFPYALFKMLTTLLKLTFQYGGQEQEAAKTSVLLFMSSILKNDLDNVVGIDDIKDWRRK